MSNFLRSGEGKDLSLAPGQSIAISTITGTVTADVIAGTAKGTNLLSASTSGGTFGPYASGAVIRVTAGEGAQVDYDIGAAPVNSFEQLAKFAFNADGTASGLVDPVSGATLYFGNYAYTWATKPAAASSLNQTIFISDVGYGGGSHWRSDGTYWRPVGGSVLLAMGSGSLANPIQSLTGVTGATFTSAQPTIPAGLIIPGAQLEVMSHVRRVGANATANYNIAIGTAGTASDANLLGFSMAATNNQDFAPSPMVDVYNATTLNTTAFLQTAGVSGASAGVDVTANFNVASAMKLSFYISSANALDTFNLIKYRFRVHM